MDTSSVLTEKVENLGEGEAQDRRAVCVCVCMCVCVCVRAHIQYDIKYVTSKNLGFPGGLDGKNLPAVQETRV